MITAHHPIYTLWLNSSLLIEDSAAEVLVLVVIVLVDEGRETVTEPVTVGVGADVMVAATEALCELVCGMEDTVPPVVVVTCYSC